MASSGLWRFTAVPARFLFVDAYAVSAIIILLVHISLGTLIFTSIVFFILMVAERKNLPPGAFFHYLRCHIGQSIFGGRTLHDFSLFKIHFKGELF